MILLRDPDAALVMACKNPEGEGFEAAFEAIFLKYRDRVYSIAYRVTGSSMDAMDVVQESFSIIFRRLETFRAGSLFSTWLFRIVVNASIDQRRREQKKFGPHFQFEDAAEPMLNSELNPEAIAATKELGSQVQEAMQKLSPKLRVILALRYLEDMSYDSLAVTLGLSMGTVKSRLARAHIALEKVLRAQYPHLHDQDSEQRAEGAS